MWDKCEPLPEMVKGVMLRARDALPAPYDFTQTWVDGSPRRGRLMFGGHSEMDGPYYVIVESWILMMTSIVISYLIHMLR